jgi:hypothetical protein
MPRRTDQSEGAKTPDYAAVTLDDELDAAWMAAELAEEVAEENAGPLDPWYSALYCLVDIQARYDAGELRPFTAKLRAYRILRPLIGRAGTVVIFAAATSHDEPIALAIRARSTKERAGAMAQRALAVDRALRQKTGVSPRAIALEILKRTDWEREALRYGPIIHRRLFERGFQGGITAAIEELDQEKGMPSETRLWKYWTFYRDYCYGRGYVDERLPMIAHGQADMPNDLLRIVDFAR